MFNCILLLFGIESITQILLFKVQRVSVTIYRTTTILTEEISIIETMFFSMQQHLSYYTAALTGEYGNNLLVPMNEKQVKNTKICGLRPYLAHF